MPILAPILLAMTLASAPAPAHAATTTLSGEALAARVQASLQSRLAETGSSATLQPVGRLADQAVPAGEVRIEVGVIAGRWPRAQASVPVLIAVDGQTVRRLNAWVRATDPRRVLAYETDLPAGTTRPQGAPMLIDMVCCEGTAIGALQELEGMRLRRAVSAGSPVLREDLEPMPAVTARQKVSVAVERGRIRIVTAGVALQDGNPGERITVRTAQSQHAIAARIVAAGEVVVDE